MLFDGKDFFVDESNAEDIIEITEIYNSNKEFLKKHTNKENVTFDWLLEDLKETRNSGFSPCKIVDKESGAILGILDFKLSSETYLSLFMLHNKYINKGIGKTVFAEFESYAKNNGSHAIRIDVVDSKNEDALRFWVKRGFQKIKEVSLSWGDAILQASLMKKDI
ncbi:MAG: GNAT family N-acetyltransferase [Clostridium sp.]|uniref:GNAT family N-acetyltransferase n=1 Tax=Clostridium sp. TaxID=1506 RepID=UPI002FC72336